ncbi:MAG: hypothetical protein COA45_07735 [Zetaproteobacteria bacterium]|nr:MAG: hypothetical protein COA45_07735 [Zetaproteobacteria bacterium]
MWGFIGKGILWAGTAFGLYTYKDEIIDTVVEEKNEIAEKGIKQYVTELGSSTEDFAAAAKENISDASKFVHDATLDPAGLAERKMKEAFERMTNPDGDGDSENTNESGSMFSAIGKLLKGDFSGAASAFTGDDGFGFGDGAKLGGIAALFYGIYKFFSGGKDDNEKDGGFDLINSTTITIGLAALAFFNRDLIMEKVNDFTKGNETKDDNVFNTASLEL